MNDFVADLRKGAAEMAAYPPPAPGENHTTADIAIAYLRKALAALDAIEKDYAELKAACVSPALNGITRVMMGQRLPCPDLGQDAAYFAFVLGRYEEALDSIIIMLEDPAHPDADILRICRDARNAGDGVHGT